jgi:hypothetical protein
VIKNNNICPENILRASRPDKENIRMTKEKTSLKNKKIEISSKIRIDRKTIPKKSTITIYQNKKSPNP